jgi:hypothetical protein
MPDKCWRPLKISWSWFADYFFDLGGKYVAGVVWADYDGGVRSLTGTGDGDNVFAVGNQAGVDRHDGNFHAYFDALPEHPQRVSHYIHRVCPAELAADASLGA